MDIVSLPNEGQQTMANSISVAIASDQSTVPVSLAAGGTTQYAEDTAHVSGDQVTLAGVVQQSADAALSSDGDRSILQVDASGFLKVNIKAGAGAGGTAMADDAPFTPAVTQGTPSFAFADETAPDSVDEGDAGSLRMTLDRKLLTRVVGATDANRLDIDGSGHAQVDIAATSVTVPVSAASLPLPTGASTSALQTQPGVDIGDVTVNNAAGASAVNVQDGGNSLTVDGTVAVSGAVDTELPAAVALADNAANPTAPAVGAFGMVWDGATWDRAKGDSTDGVLVNLGANNDVSLNAGSNNIGDVDVLSVIPGTGATNLGKAVDSVPGATDTGVAALTVRDDALAALTPADGDYTHLRVNSQGALWTNDLNSAQVSTAVQLLGGDTYVEAVSKGMAVGAVRHDADTTLVNTTEEWAPFQLDANGRLKVEAFSGETLPVSLTSTTITGAVDTELPAAAALADNTANPTVPAVGSFLMAFDGTNWDRVQTGAAATGSLKVDGSAVTQPVSGTVTANAGTNLNTSLLALESGGNLATAVASLSVLDDWDETDRAKVNIIAGQVGVAGDAGAVGATVQRVVQANGAGKTILSAGGSASSSGNNTLVAAGTNRLKVFAFSLTTLSTTAMTCIFQSGASGTELWRVIIQAPTGVSAGANLSTALPAWLFATASATLLNLNLSSANAVHWSVSYYNEA